MEEVKFPLKITVVGREDPPKWPHLNPATHNVNLLQYIAKGTLLM